MESDRRRDIEVIRAVYSRWELGDFTSWEAFADDYIWVSAEIEVLDSGVCFDRPSPTDASLLPSDHAGVWADLQILGPSRQPDGLD